MSRSTVVKRPRVQLHCGVGLTKQSFRDECDINTIMKKYQISGLVDHVNKHQGQYGDFSNPVDYQTALNIVIEAQDMFDSLPSTVRARFANDPASFLEFVNNPDNRSEMKDMGLLREDIDVPNLVPLEALKSNENAPE